MKNFGFTLGVYLLLSSPVLQIFADIDDLFSRCPAGYFGYKCRFRCHCVRGEVCHKRTGECRQCAQGFWGPGCQLSYDCYYNGQKKLYMGTMSTTESGLSCQRWDRTTPHDHDYTPKDFPDRVYPHNYCRNTKDASRPWCYTTNPNKRWDYCNVNNCDCVDGRFGQNCAKECHCKPQLSRDRGETCDSILGMCREVRECGTGWRDFGCQTASSCPRNRYGWDCGRRCHCVNAGDCDRFSGPRPTCRCDTGYFRPPYCKPVTEPVIMRFTNTRVNPGQPTIFNCTVSSVPMPQSRDIKVFADNGHPVSLIQSNVPIFTTPYTLINVFRDDAVFRGAAYTCRVRSVAGETSRTISAAVFSLPSLTSPPIVTTTHSTNLTLHWRPWHKGDQGDPPIKRYTIWYRKLRDVSDRKSGNVPHSRCGEKCVFVITGLNPHTEYVVYVVTWREGEGGAGPPGPEVRAKTSCGAPSKPVTITKSASNLVTNFTDTKATFSLVWQDPPEASLNCNHITHYFIYLTKGSAKGSEPDMITRSGKAGRTYVLGGLDPYTRYCVRLKLQTDARRTSPFSQFHCLTTPEAVPLPPSKPRIIKRYSDSAVVSWHRPYPANGNITRYRLTLWDWEGEEKDLVVDSTSEYVEYLLPGLMPFREYHVEVSAVSGAGSGKKTKALKFQTTEGVPGPVGWVRNTTRTGTSISLEWKSPGNDKGHITQFTVSCKPITSLLGHKLAAMTSEKVSASVSRYTLVGLLPAVKYACGVNASTRFGTGPQAVTVVWTKAIEPSIPDTPHVDATSEHTVTVSLRTSPDKFISFYRVIVEKVPRHKNPNSRVHKRETNELLETVANGYANSQDSAYYVAAHFGADHTDGQFTVGDNNTYGGYYNAPLEERRSYNIWWGAYANVDGDFSTSFAKTTSPVLTVNAVTNPHRAGSPIAVIVGVLVGFLLLVIVFALVIFFWRRRALRAESEKEDISTFVSVPQPTFLPETDTSPPPTPLEPREHTEIQPLLQKGYSKLDYEPIYGNILAAVEPIRVEDLWDYIRKQKEDDMHGLQNEFKLLPAGLTAKYEVAKRNCNKNKNRYGNIIAYDHSRVVLQTMDDDPYSDYINANYIDGYRKRAAYIAAQGPTRTTLGDIWRMAWQDNCKTIIMLTNPTETGRKKCDAYWPDEGCGNYGNISVQMTSCDVLPDFTIRTFLLTKGEESKLVKQFHYTTWPDHGVPKFCNSLILFRQKVRAYDPLLNGPPIIHCSAGVGRTGTYIAIDTQLERARHEGIVDVHNFVQMMRTMRVNMVQTLEQYTYVYDVLLEALISGETTSSLREYRDNYRQLCLPQPGVGRAKIDEQFEILCLISSTLFKSESSNAMDADNVHKNRFKSIVPSNRCRPYLISQSDNGNDYINAVFANSYLRRDAFILSQMPLPHTICDLWRLVYDHHCYTIVMLNDIPHADQLALWCAYRLEQAFFTRSVNGGDQYFRYGYCIEDIFCDLQGRPIEEVVSPRVGAIMMAERTSTCEPYWSTGDSCTQTYGSFTVETTAQIIADPAITVRDFTIANTAQPDEKPRVVRQFQLHHWLLGCDIPSSKAAFRDLMTSVAEWQLETRVTHPVLIHCMDGCTRSGLLSAAFTLQERVQTDLEVDVFQTVKSLRINRPQAVATIEQYRFLHDLSLDFLTSATADSSFAFASSAVMP